MIKGFVILEISEDDILNNSEKHGVTPSLMQTVVERITRQMNKYMHILVHEALVDVEDSLYYLDIERARAFCVYLSERIRENNPGEDRANANVYIDGMRGKYVSFVIRNKTEIVWFYLDSEKINDSRYTMGDLRVNVLYDAPEIHNEIKE